MQRDLTKVDFAKNRTDFTEELERQYKEHVLELQRAAEEKGFISKLIFIATKKPFFAWN